MFDYRLIAISILVAAVLCGGAIFACPPRNGVAGTVMPENNQELADPRVLGEGSISPVKSQFIAIVRDVETYQALKAIATDLPNLNGEFFNSNWVVAAFLGERNTSGYSVSISRDPNGQIRVTEKTPPKDAMLAQVMTAPFKIVSLPVRGTPPVAMFLAESFRRTGDLYRIKNGSFSISGGVAGRRETLTLGGKIQIMRLGSLVTIGFAMVSEGATNERRLRDNVTVLMKENAFVIPKLNHGSLVDTPSGDLRINASLAEKNELKLDLDTGPVTVPDGFSGKGSVAAEFVAPSELK